MDHEQIEQQLLAKKETLFEKIRSNSAISSEIASFLQLKSNFPSIAPLTALELGQINNELLKIVPHSQYQDFISILGSYAKLGYKPHDLKPFPIKQLSTTHYLSNLGVKEFLNFLNNVAAIGYDKLDINLDLNELNKFLNLNFGVIVKSKESQINILHFLAKAGYKKEECSSGAILKIIKNVRNNLSSFTPNQIASFIHSLIKIGLYSELISDNPNPDIAILKFDDAQIKKLSKKSAFAILQSKMMLDLLCNDESQKKSITGQIVVFQPEIFSKITQNSSSQDFDPTISKLQQKISRKLRNIKHSKLVKLVTKQEYPIYHIGDIALRNVDIFLQRSLEDARPQRIYIEVDGPSHYLVDSDIENSQTQDRNAINNRALRLLEQKEPSFEHIFIRISYKEFEKDPENILTIVERKINNYKNSRNREIENYKNSRDSSHSSDPVALGIYEKVPERPMDFAAAGTGDETLDYQAIKIEFDTSASDTVATEDIFTDTAKKKNKKKKQGTKDTKGTPDLSQRLEESLELHRPDAELTEYTAKDIQDKKSKKKKKKKNPASSTKDETTLDEPLNIQLINALKSETLEYDRIRNLIAAGCDLNDPDIFKHAVANSYKIDNELGFEREVLQKDRIEILNMLINAGAIVSIDSKEKDLIYKCQEILYSVVNNNKHELEKYQNLFVELLKFPEIKPPSITKQVTGKNTKTSKKSSTSEQESLLKIATDFRCGPIVLAIKNREDFVTEKRDEELETIIKTKIETINNISESYAALIWRYLFEDDNEEIYSVIDNRIKDLQYLIDIDAFNSNDIDVGKLLRNNLVAQTLIRTGKDELLENLLSKVTDEDYSLCHQLIFASVCRLVSDKVIDVAFNFARRNLPDELFLHLINRETAFRDGEQNPGNAATANILFNYSQSPLLFVAVNQKSHATIINAISDGADVEYLHTVCDGQVKVNILQFCLFNSHYQTFPILINEIAKKLEPKKFLELINSFDIPNQEKIDKKPSTALGYCLSQIIDDRSNGFDLKDIKEIFMDLIDKGCSDLIVNVEGISGKILYQAVEHDLGDEIISALFEREAQRDADKKVYSPEELNHIVKLWNEKKQKDAQSNIQISAIAKLNEGDINTKHQKG